MNTPNSSNKVTAATAASAAGALIVWLAGAAGVPIPAGAEAAIVTVLVFAAGYVINEYNPSPSARATIDAELASGR